MSDKFGGKAIDDLVQSVEKAFGRGIIMPAEGGPVDDTPIDVIPTGLVELDRALGVGGLPRGRIVEIAGPDNTGMTTLAMLVAARAQGQDLVVALVDAEHAFVLADSAALGVNNARMLLSQPDCGEQAMDVVEALVRSGEIGLVIVDSVRGLVPKAEIDGTAGEMHEGLQARLMSRAMRKLASLAHQTGTTLVFINPDPKRNENETIGGNALKFYASIRLRLDQVGQQRVRIKVLKNKLAPPFRECVYRLEPGKGFVDGQPDPNVTPVPDDPDA